MSKYKGVNIPEMERRTGMTRREIEGLIKRDEIRWRKPVGRVLLHPADVSSIEKSTWNGSPVEVPS